MGEVTVCTRPKSPGRWVMQTALPRHESPGAPSKAGLGSVGPGWALRLRIFNQLPGDADAAGSGPTLRVV